MDEVTQTRLTGVIQNAYREYPDTPNTVDEMIRQALRIGYVRGLSAGALADAIADSGLLWELEQEAFNRGYATAEILAQQMMDEAESE